MTAPFDWMAVRLGDVLRINGSRPCIVTDITLQRAGGLDFALASTNGKSRGHVYTSSARLAPAVWARDAKRRDRDVPVERIEIAGPNTLDPPEKKA